MALPDPTHDTTVLVTGASSGIGEALARELARRGYGLTLVARRREKLEALGAALEDEYGVEVELHPTDLASDRSRARVLRAVRGDERTLIGLCNNAGVGAIGHAVDHDASDEESVFRLNALALFDLTNQLSRDMVSRGVGAILNTASILAFAPIPQNATYAATKAFVASYSEALHTELSGTGVSCTTVNPGPTRTPVFENSGAPGAAGAGPGIFWQDAGDVARPAVDGMIRGDRSVIPGLTNKLAVLGLSFTPRAALLPLSLAAQSAPVRRLLLGDEHNGNDQS
jgi:short-subunit dehydrogenase